MTRTLSLALVLGLLALGCGGSDDDDEGGPAASAGGGPSGGGSAASDFLGSCDTRSVAGSSVGQCRDWIGDATVDLLVSCNGLDGEFSASEPCPEAGRAGTCTLDPVLGVSAVYGYYEPEYSVEDAEDHCAALGGAFVN